jgi:GNAT superfamily N-acetyltransferase
MFRERKPGVIRPAVQSDSEAIISLWRRLVTEYDVAADYLDVPSAVEKWSYRLGKQIEETKAFVAVLDDKVVGFAGYVGRPAGEKRQTGQTAPAGNPRLPIPAGIAYVTDLYVIPEARKRGVAQRLLMTIIDNSESTGFSAVWTNTNTRNKRTLGLLAKMGFTPLADFHIPDLENQAYYAKELR